MAVEAQTEKLSFEAEVKQLLNLVAHSLYSNKEIFLRELISNASDAADKMRYEALSNNALYEGDSELKIEVEFNEDNKTITIRDNGIGMNRDEVIANLGTIAKSGTRAFKELLSKDAEKDSQLIGQFGVGFYSAFIVADNVVVRTRRAGMKADEGVRWESDGQGEYALSAIEKASRGTEITLHIKDDQKEFLNDYRLRTIIRQYSDHIALPIKMAKPLSEDDKKKAEKGEIIVPEQETVNQANALWTLPRSEITQEQYDELYKHVSHDFEAPLLTAHNKVEGKSEYTSLLYIPKRPPFDMWDRDQKKGVKLYVKRVFVMDDADHFLPNYMRFVKGVVDTNDLPLNISRELLQSNATIERIKSGCVKRVLSTLEKCADNDADNYKIFWQSFGSVLKEGPAEDMKNKERIAKLLRFSSTEADQEEQTVSLSDYLGRMKPEQEEIYYLISDSHMAAKNSPLLELFKKKGIEVMLLSERVDEWLMGHLTEFEGKKFKSISQGEVDLGKMDDEDTKEKKKEAEKTYKGVVEMVKKALGERIEDVRVTHRLTDSPACVVFPENAMSGHMQRLMQAAGQAVPQAKPILELNPDHVLVKHLKEQKDESAITQWSNLLLGQALLAEGEPIKDPADFVRNLNTMLQDSIR
jgi:molecular chaperone HtpG